MELLIIFLKSLLIIIPPTLLCLYFIRKDIKALELLRKEALTREQELLQFKTSAGIDEYARQEVLAFLNHNVYWNLTEIQFDESWNAYKKSKLK